MLLCKLPQLSADTMWISLHFLALTDLKVGN